mgnify:FL=1|tara:strand:- start:1316 stop:1450 length:135 start_codon:yes stop_codon:yes gene_type:complete
MKTINKFRNLGTFEKVQLAILGFILFALSNVVVSWIANGFVSHF